MEIFPSRYVGVFSLQDNFFFLRGSLQDNTSNNNGFATTHPTCNFSIQSRKLHQ